MQLTAPLTIAVPKGRILSELEPLLSRVGIYPEESFFDEEARALQFSCKNSPITLVRVRSFDVATFVAFGGAHVGIAGSDVLLEFDYHDIYMPLDLNIGHCRLSVAAPFGTMSQKTFARASHMRVATKYPNLTRQYFAGRGVQAECIKLSGAMELAPALGMAECIVDLVSSGATLRANGLEEVDVMAKISSRLVINRSVFKTRSTEINSLIASFREAVDEQAA